MNVPDLEFFGSSEKFRNRTRTALSGEERIVLNAPFISFLAQKVQIKIYSFIHFSSGGPVTLPSHYSY